MSKERQKGTAWETATVNFLREQGFVHAERRALHGATDLGDITGVPGVVFECKSHKTYKLGEWADETAEERDNAKADVGVLIVKRVGKAGADKGYWIMSAEDGAFLLKEAGYA